MYKIAGVLITLLITFQVQARADWVERSDAITLEVMRAQGAFSPEYMSSQGLEEFDADIFEPGETYRKGAIAVNEAQIARLEKLLKGESDARVRQDLGILIAALQQEITTSELAHAHLIPFADLHAALFDSIDSLLDPRVAAQRKLAALERLRKYNGSAAGSTPVTELAMDASTARFGVPGLLGPYRGEVENTLESAPHLLAGLKSLFENSGLEGWEADFALLESQLDAYAGWLRKEMLPRSREDNRLPPALYANALRSFGVDASPDELKRLAQYSYQLLRTDMRALARRIAQERNWEDDELRAVIARLKQEQLPPEKVLPMYRDTLAKLEDIIRREHIVTLPARDAVIRNATEAESAASPASFMSPPQLVGNTGQYGEFVLVQRNPALGEEAQMDDFSHAAVAWTLTVHEVRPGHELQFTSMVEEGVSLARATYAFNSANVEGWALYAESVMLPFLPLEGQLFALYSQSWRAARMFLDPMVNTGDLSRDGARDFLMREFVMSEPMASSEADRYAYRLPGQATSYYFGFMGLMRLRTELAVALGDDFDQQAFHDFILQQGLLPPELLRKAVLEKFVP